MYFAMQTLHNKYSCTDIPTPTKKKKNSGSSDPDLFSWGSEGNLAVNKKNKLDDSSRTPLFSACQMITKGNMKGLIF